MFDTYHEELACLHNDLYKDVYGFRPRHYDYGAMSVDDLNRELDLLGEVYKANKAREAEREERAVEDFKAWIRKTIEAGAGDEETALRWIVEGHDFYCPFDIEHWVWGLGILFTDYGKDLIKRVEEIVEYKVPEAT